MQLSVRIRIFFTTLLLILSFNTSSAVLAQSESLPQYEVIAGDSAYIVKNDAEPLLEEDDQGDCEEDESDM